MNKAVTVVSRSYLRRGQACLYDLIVDKLANDENITIDEARHIWETKVCRKMYKGVPHRTDYFANPEYRDDGTFIGYTAKDVPMTPEEVDFTVMNWLTKNIGVLVMRGYLKVIPMIQLTD